MTTAPLAGTGGPEWQKELNSVAARTSLRIGRALDKMIAELPKGATPEMALDLVVRRLIQIEADHMSLIVKIGSRELLKQSS